MPRKKINHLAAENCNKARCKSCIFHTNGNQVELGEGRLDEIKAYLMSSSSHMCHTTNKTCYGGLEFQAQIFYRLGVIPAETVQSFLDTAKQTLKI